MEYFPSTLTKYDNGNVALRMCLTEIIQRQLLSAAAPRDMYGGKKEEGPLINFLIFIKFYTKSHHLHSCTLDWTLAFTHLHPKRPGNNLSLYE